MSKITHWTSERFSIKSEKSLFDLPCIYCTACDLHACSRRLGVRKSSRTEDDQQSGKHFPSGPSSAVYDQLFAVTDLWLVQLPSFWQDVSAQHSWHSTHRQLNWHRIWQRLDMVESNILQCRLKQHRTNAGCNVVMKILHISVKLLSLISEQYSVK